MAQAIRLASAFDYVVGKAEKKLPWLARTNLCFCAVADRDHRKKWRQFMHSGHRAKTVCVARAAEEELTDKELVGMFAHELGHVVGIELRFPEHEKKTRGSKTPQAVQDEADWIARNVLGFKIKYNRRTLQEEVGIKSNPEDDVITSVMSFARSMGSGGFTAYDIRSNFPFITQREAEAAISKLYRAGKLSRSTGWRSGREMHLYEEAT